MKWVRRESTARRTAAAAVLLGVLAVIATAAALGAGGPPAPTITSKPASPTSSTSASFVFSSPPSGGSNQCKLDSGAFGACTTATTRNYTGLAAGSHTFAVQAVDNKGKASSPSSWTWVIDTTPPSVVSIARSGSSPTNASPVSWTVTFSEAVTGVDSSDFALAKVGVATAALTTATGSGSSYTVSASTGSGDGSLGLNLVDNDSILDVPGNKLGGPGAGNANFTGQAYALDRTGPASAPTISAGPTGLVASTSASFTFASSESGVAGYQCALDGGAFSSCTSPRSYSGLGQGTRSFQVRAVDSLGNPGPAASRSWTVDTVAPAVSVFTRQPPDPSSTSTSTFAWTNSSADVASYQCSKENGAFQPCSTPLTYVVGVTNNGQHQFAVRAIDHAGNVSGVAAYSWKVDKGSPQLLTVTGTVTNLYIGVVKPVAVTITNPNPEPAYVTALTMTLSTTAGSGGCAASNFSITQSNASSAVPIAVPANGSVVVSTAPQAPRLLLVDLAATNQDVCKNKSFALTFTWSAHS